MAQAIGVMTSVLPIQNSARLSFEVPFGFKRRFRVHYLASRYVPDLVHLP